MGSDAGVGRSGRRVDVMLLVEIDVATGKVAMIGLPRNLQNAPYPPGPAHDYSHCGCQSGLLNEMYTEATIRHPDRWPGKGAIKGIGAVRSVVSELTGRPIDAVLIVDLIGVVRVVDAMGGIDINVPRSVTDTHYPDPVRGSIYFHVNAGQQHFDGLTALAYARTRHADSDYARMSRQQTVLLAIRNGLGIDTLVNAPALFAAAKKTAWTDLPRESLPALVELFGRAQTASVKQLRIVPPAYPSWMTKSELAAIRKAVGNILGPLPNPTPTPSPSPSEPPIPSESPSPSPSETPAPSPTPEPSPSPSPPAPSDTPLPSASP
jgi:LCP family protein required for cell wall assembly